MASQKLTALTALTGANLASGDKLLAVDVSDTTMDASGTDKSMTAAELSLGMQALLGMTPQVKSADQTLTASNTTLQNITDLGLAIGASATEKWFVQYWLLIFSANNTMDIKFGFTVPSGATVQYGGIGGGLAGWGTSATGSTPVAIATAADTFSVGSAANATFGLTIAAIIVGGGTAGTVQIQASENTSDAGSLKIKANSLLLPLRVAA